MAAGGAIPNGAYFYYWAAVTALGETTSYLSTSVTTGGGSNSVTLQNPSYSDPRVIGINVYRSKVGTSSPAYLVTRVVGSSATYLDNLTDAQLSGTTVPTTDTAQGGAMALSSIPTSGDARVVSRILYRTKVGGSDYFFHSTLGDNTSTTVTDTLADSALGAAAPAGSTIALPVGHTSIQVADLAQVASRGFVQVGSQVLAYTARSASSGAGSLTGVPASGPGSIVAPLASGAAVVACAQLEGINGGSPGGLAYAVALGSTIAVWVQRDNLAGQTALAALEGGDGIREDTFFDGRMGEDLLTQELDARLAAFAAVTLGVSYDTLDVKTRVGATVHVAVGSAALTAFFDPTFFDPAFFDTASAPAVLPIIAGDFVIQDVAITFIGKLQRPVFRVQASSVAFTLTDLLRLLQL